MGNEIEKRDKEDSGKRLSPNQRAAVVLEANGYKRPDIAKAIGISSGTVKAWHENPDYMRELEKTSRDIDQALEPIIEVLRTRLGTSMLKAQEVIEEGLMALNKDGTPYWSVRMRAAELLLNSFKIVAPQEEKDKDGPAIGTLVMNVDKETAGKMVEAAMHVEQGPKKVDAIDVDAIED